MCLGEELCHAVNPDLSLAAVAVARGYNAGGRYKDAEAICAKLLGLLPATMRKICWASVLQVGEPAAPTARPGRGGEEKCPSQVTTSGQKSGQWGPRVRDPRFYLRA